MFHNEDTVCIIKTFITAIQLSYSLIKNRTLPLVLIMIVLTTRSFSQSHQTARPNIILIIADDLGYSDLASYGNKFIHTPNIDGLGKDGVRFTQAHVTSPICSPSRMGIMTGRYQNRFGSEYMPYDKFDPAFIKKIRSHYL